MPYGHYIFMQYICRDAMLRVFFPTGFIVKFVPFHLVLNQDLKISRITENVFVLIARVICRGLLYILLFADVLHIGEMPGNESTI
jgi:hypothetical protein